MWQRAAGVRVTELLGRRRSRPGAAEPREARCAGGPAMHASHLPAPRSGASWTRTSGRRRSATAGAPPRRVPGDAAACCLLPADGRLLLPVPLALALPPPRLPPLLLPPLLLPCGSRPYTRTRPHPSSSPARPQDIRPWWDSILKTLDYNVGLSRFAGPGRWNDLDMLYGEGRGFEAEGSLAGCCASLGCVGGQPAMWRLGQPGHAALYGGCSCLSGSGRVLCGCRHAPPLHPVHPPHLPASLPPCLLPPCLPASSSPPETPCVQTPAVGNDTGLTHNEQRVHFALW